MNNKLQAKDLINLGLFTVLYFVLGCCVAIPIGFVPIFLPILGALWTLITGIPFMLFLTRVKKFAKRVLAHETEGALKVFSDLLNYLPVCRAHRSVMIVDLKIILHFPELISNCSV